MPEGSPSAALVRTSALPLISLCRLACVNGFECMECGFISSFYELRWYHDAFVLMLTKAFFIVWKIKEVLY